MGQSARAQAPATSTTLPGSPPGDIVKPNRPVAGRRQQIDALRWLAIFAVLFDHYTRFHGLVRPGDVAIRLFLIISGYLITGIALRIRTGAETGQGSRTVALRNFYVRRALRIWPAYLLALAGVWISNTDGAREFIAWHLLFLSNILFALRDSWDPPWVLAHLWTLSVQEQFYLVWPVVLLLLPRKFFLPILVCSVLLALLFRALMVALGTAEATAAFVLPFASLDALAAGAILAIGETRLNGYTRFKPRLSLVIGAAIIVLGVQHLFDGHWTYILAPTLWLVPCSLLMVGAIAGYSGWFGLVLDNRAMQYLGRISLGIYLYHLPLWGLVQETAYRWDLYLFPPGLAALISMTLLSVGAAAASWELLERHINSLKSRFPYGAGGERARRPVECLDGVHGPTPKATSGAP
jgi:peptidoglycan/LPS O-acetylase OafA/YrhL